MGGTEEPQIKKLGADRDFSINNMVSYHIPMETLRAEVEKFKGGNITNCFEKWANITQDQFVLNIFRFGLTMEFAEVHCAILYHTWISLLGKLKLLMQKFPNFSVKV